MLTGWRKTVSKYFIVPHRLIVSTMGFLSIMLAYTIRTSLSLSITKMVISHGGSASAEECLADDDNPNKPKPHGDFDWSEELQGVILASFYIGYVITHVPGGYYASRFGGKNTLLLGMSVAAFFTLITPVCVQAGGAPVLITLRILIGLGEGLIFPSCNALLASWVPLKERSKMGTLTYSGAQIGSIFGSLVSGALLGTYDGWGSVFYFFGGISIIWIVIFWFICYKDPESHPFISEKEKEYLKNEMGQYERPKNIKSVPWRHILTSPAVIALIFAQLGHNWGFFIMVTDLPKYMNDVLKFSIKENGVYNALPFIAMWIVAQLTGFLSDFIISKGYMSITNVRKFFTIFAAIGPGCFIIGASYAGCDKMLVVALFTIGMGCMGTFYSGMKVNNLDLAPNYAGVIMAMTNGIGGINGILAPYIVGVLTPDSLMSQWRIVFWSAFVIFALTSVIYAIWASGEVQPWNNLNIEHSEENGKVDENEKSTQIDENIKTDELKLDDSKDLKLKQ